MIIKNTIKPKLNFKKFFRIGLSLVALVFLFQFVFYPLYLKYSTLEDGNIILCDTETVHGKHFISNGKKFRSGETQSLDFAHTGNYSSKLNRADAFQYGIGYNLKHFKPGDIYKASVWVKKSKPCEALLVCSGVNDSKFYQVEHQPGKVENGFYELSMTVQIPKYYKESEAKIYVYTDGKEVVYFDDLKIEPLDSLPDTIAQYHFDPAHLELDIKDKNYKKLQAKRIEAYKEGVLITDEDSWVNAKLEDADSEIPVKIRLKGDWLDHINNDKWSFRVKAKSTSTWNRMVTFSVHTPAARYFALEWLLHQFWEQEDILTTRYDFVDLSVNGKHLGTYAYEEHFEKQLLEFRNRREGPIIRFSEDGLWDARSRKIQMGFSANALPQEEAKINAAEIKPFKESKIAKSESLSKQFQIAQNLLYQYQKGLKPPAEVFDIEQMAKYNAIADIFGASHSIVWHNQRFYYNPVSSLLEPIGFDGFAHRPRRDPLILGKAMLENGDGFNHGPLLSLYNDEVFIEAYMKYLDLYTQEDFLQSFFNETKKGMDARVDFLKIEFPEFKYDPARIKKRARQIRFRLLPYQEHSIRANWMTTPDGNSSLQISNSHELPLQIIGTGKNIKQIIPLEKEVHMPAFRLGIPKKARTISAPANAQFVFFKPYGIDTTFSSKISQWSAPQDFVPRQEVFKNVSLQSNSIYSVNQNQVYFKEGKHQTNKDIIIPKGYQVIFEAGCALDFIRGAKFLSLSPVALNGTSNDPVLISSSDKTANGFTVLQSPQMSMITSTTFQDFNTMSESGWNLTGAVTFYEADVTLQNVRIKDNLCEDALNIIRSNFYINGLELTNTAFDGFDADFCTGIVENSTFTRTGNDGIDFSGSRVEIIDCKISNAGDKGISVGEESKVIVQGTTIDGAVIGLASKDLSYLKVKDITLKNCNQGFAAYQKKPEYGRSTIFVDQYFAEEVKYLHTIAPRCTLELKGQVIIGE